MDQLMAGLLDPEAEGPHGTPGVESVGGLGMAVKVVFDTRERREAHWRGLRAEAGVRIEDMPMLTFQDLAIIATEAPGRKAQSLLEVGC